MTNRESDPVAWLSKCYSDDNEDLGYNLWDIDVGEGCFPVYTAPPKREWVDLTDDEFLELAQTAERGNYLTALRRMQAKLKEKNGG